MTEDEALAEYIAAGKALAEGRQARSRYWRTKEVLFQARKTAGKFPSDTCPTCLARGQCCENHATCGGFCLHCGFDFR